MLLVQVLFGGVDRSCDRFQVLALLQEVMIEEECCALAQVRVDLEAVVEEALQIAVDLRLRRRPALRLDVIDRLAMAVIELARQAQRCYFQRRLVHVRRFSVEHFDYHDSQRPDIDFLVVLHRPIDDFRCHPVRRADHRLSTAGPGPKLSAKPKISQFNIAGHAQQHIV